MAHFRLTLTLTAAAVAALATAAVASPVPPPPMHLSAPFASSGHMADGGMAVMHAQMTAGDMTAMQAQMVAGGMTDMHAQMVATCPMLEAGAGGRQPGTRAGDDQHARHHRERGKAAP